MPSFLPIAHAIASRLRLWLLSFIGWLSTKRLPSLRASLRAIRQVCLLSTSLFIIWALLSWAWGIMHPPHRDSIAAVKFPPGIVKNGTYSKMIVVPRLSNESVSWIDENFGKDSGVEVSVYLMDDDSALLHAPTNKGHEVMGYLSYIIDHYDNLSDVNIFMHSQRYTWHNNHLMADDTVEMIQRLSSPRVQREGYMNLRCHWDPGCPSWMHPGTKKVDEWKPEQHKLAEVWTELFPFDYVPRVLAQPCCSQFALSAERIRSLPLAKYVGWRDWLLKTDLSDYISGRVWEYFWQFVFTGHNVMCPKEHVCYCDGYGICLGGKKQFDAYMEKHKEKEHLERELEKWRETNHNLTAQIEVAETDQLKQKLMTEVGRDLELDGKIRRLNLWCESRRNLAKERGSDPKVRAKEAGRSWKDGDGF